MASEAPVIARLKRAETMVMLRFFFISVVSSGVAVGDGIRGRIQEFRCHAAAVARVQRPRSRRIAEFATRGLAAVSASTTTLRADGVQPRAAAPRPRLPRGGVCSGFPCVDLLDSPSPVSRYGASMDPNRAPAVQHIGRRPVDVAALSRAMFTEGPWLFRLMQHHRHRIAPIARCIELVPMGADLLDIGCGGGLFIACLVAERRVCSAHGIDASAGAIAIAQSAAQRLRHRVPEIEVCFEHRRAEQGLLPREYGAVTMIDVMHHIPSVDAQKQAFMDAASRVRQGGVFLYKDMCDAPVWRAGMNRLHDLIMARQWIRYLPIEVADGWAAEAGLHREVAEERSMLWYGHEIRLYRRQVEPRDDHA